MENFISDNKLYHIQAVAELMYDITLKLGFDQEIAEQMYLLGFVHDIGYIRQPQDHSTIGSEILYNSNYKYWSEVKNHGKLIDNPSLALKLLWFCDLHVDHKGIICTFEDRLQDIENRYGISSKQYKNVKEIIQYLKEDCSYLLDLDIVK